jgi:hypothetical protein
VRECAFFNPSLRCDEAGGQVGWPCNCRPENPPTTPEPQPSEVDTIAQSFDRLLRQASGDGAKKRAAGTKPIWLEDDTHMGAYYRHIRRWEEGERADPDSGADPRIHAAWRLLAAVDYERHQAVK